MHLRGQRACDGGELELLGWGSQGGFADQAGQGAQVAPDIGQKDGGFASGKAKDGQAFEVQGFQEGIAGFRSIASVVVKFGMVQSEQRSTFTK